MKKLIPLFILIVPMFFVNCKKIEIPLDRFWIQGDSTLIKGNTCKYSIIYEPSKATNTKVAWSSSDENVITIAPDGTATAKNYGSAVIYAQSTDGSNLTNSHNVYVLSKTKISIRQIDNVTYYSAKFSLSFTNGSFSDFSYGLYFNTVPEVDSLHNIASYITSYPDSVFIYNMLDANTKYYARAYIRNKFGIVYSDSVMLQTSALPTGLMGNYMLNNALTDGFVAKCENWIYFINKNTNNKLCRIKDDLTGFQQIASSSGVFSINIIPPYIYYSNGTLFKSRLDGSNAIQIPAPGTTYYYARSQNPFQILENEIYYANSHYLPNTYKLYKISTQGTDMVNLTTTGYQDYCINIFNNSLYYIENYDTVKMIYKSDLNGLNKSEVYKRKTFNSLGVYENSIFFMDKDSLFSFDINNPALIQKLPMRIYLSTYNIANYNIFFSNAGDINKLYKSDINGQSAVKLSDDTAVGDIYVIDDWLYYYSYDGSTSYLYRIKQDGSNHQLVN